MALSKAIAPRQVEQMNHVDTPMQAYQQAMQARQTAEHWLAGFETALSSENAAQLTALFHQECHWREHTRMTSNLADQNVDARTNDRAQPI